MTVLCGSGHRLTNYNGRMKKELRMYARMVLRRHKPSVVVAGGALGWDQALAWAAIDLDIPLRLVLPFYGMEQKWQPDIRAEFKRMVALATHTECMGVEFDIELYQARNVKMVDQSEAVLALWDGRRGGGTFNCLQYAHAKDRRVFHLWQEWEDWWPRRVAAPETRLTG